MASVTILINRAGGAAQADRNIGDKAAEALRQAGVDARVELIAGGECEVRSRAIAERGDDLLILGSCL
jgi:diacylglycerol kinase family enzyme